VKHATLIIAVVGKAFSCMTSRHLERGGYGYPFDDSVHGLRADDRDVLHMDNWDLEEARQTSHAGARFEYLHVVNLRSGSQKLADTAIASSSHRADQFLPVDADSRD